MHPLLSTMFVRTLMIWLGVGGLLWLGGATVHQSTLTGAWFSLGAWQWHLLRRKGALRPAEIGVYALYMLAILVGFILPMFGYDTPPAGFFSLLGSAVAIALIDRFVIHLTHTMRSCRIKPVRLASTTWRQRTQCSGRVATGGRAATRARSRQNCSIRSASARVTRSKRRRQNTRRFSGAREHPPACGSCSSPSRRRAAPPQRRGGALHTSIAPPSNAWSYGLTHATAPCRG